MNARKITSSLTPPSTCSSSYHFPSIPTGTRTGRNRPRDRAGSEDDGPVEGDGLRRASARDRAHVPDHQPAGVDVRGADVEAAALAVRLPDLGDDLGRDHLLDPPGERLGVEHG